MTFAASDDELALVAGHELGHIIHRDGKATSLADRRNMEDRADEAGAHLAKCAGYDVTAALGFWDRYANRRKLSFLYGPSHRSPRDRAARMAAFIAGDSCGATALATP